MSYFLLGGQLLHLLTPEELAYRLIHVVTRYSYIAFLIFLPCLIGYVLFLELRGLVHLRTVNTERLDDVELNHPYIPPSRGHIFATIALVVTFPVFCWQAQAQVVAITTDESSDPYVIAGSGSDTSGSGTTEIALSSSGSDLTSSGSLTGSGSTASGTEIAMTNSGSTAS